MEGQVWLATGRDDLRRFDPQSQTWETFNAVDLGFKPLEDEGYQGHFLSDVELSRNQKVWVGDCIGVGEGLSGQGIRWSHEGFWFDAPFTQGECVLDIEIDSLGRMWVSGFDALLQYDPNTNAWTRISLPNYERRQLVAEITLDKNDNPWVEIMRYGGASPLGQVARFHLQDDEWIRDYEGWFSSLALGGDGVAWICSEGSVYRLENGEVEDIFNIPGNQCQVIIDGNGRIWVTNTSDLWWIDPR
jgi:streptogramin lyase